MARQKKFTTDELFQMTRRLLLDHGYEGFSFSVLATRLDVSRGTIYKYFENKEDLVTEYMLYEMNKYLEELKGIHQYELFEDQLDFLLDLMFRDQELLQVIEMGQKIPIQESDRAKLNHEKIETLHIDMYQNLADMIKLGKEQGKVREEIPDSLVLGFIFQSITIPNHFGVPPHEWVRSIKDVIRHGMFKELN
ncbi:TetR/AcrR family transcriptional regulator [Piscibacillus halophilus]|uniref:Transcriptional regulator, TetR family n=1 Tax=Piscibacillus halophilus TaxID=571933 RepID=A0A1H9L9P3_9BACI|nr:TetR/AcrR family transcriptional regulator [Piscibacillus halophilus]SER07855.1 transcriptional regulator, TetR family [Piscibacillus halophilus]